MARVKLVKFIKRTRIQPISELKRLFDLHIPYVFDVQRITAVLLVGKSKLGYDDEFYYPELEISAYIVLSDGSFDCESYPTDSLESISPTIYADQGNEKYLLKVFPDLEFESEEITSDIAVVG